MGNRSEEANSDAADSDRGVVPATVGDFAEVRIVVPTTTSADAAGRIVRMFIEAPLEDVATHIIQPIAIRFLLTYTMRLPYTIYREPTHFVQVITSCIGVILYSSGCIFPLGFRWKTIPIRFFIHFYTLCIYTSSQSSVWFLHPSSIPSDIS